MEGTSSRFRTASVSTAQSVADRTRHALGDDERLFDTAAPELQVLVGGGQFDELLEVLEVVREHPNHQVVYRVHKAAAEILLATAKQRVQPVAAAPYYDMVVATLEPYLRERPAEPELLNLAGVAYFQLGQSEVSAELFGAVTTIEPEHGQAAANLTALHASGGKSQSVPAQAARRSLELEKSMRQIATSARELADRTISLCMIVKDEEEMLPGCLDAVREWVDEMTVVDTGSTDRTREIAEERGARVVDFPWTGSFSEARNRSIEDATGDWILFLDADEHLIGDDGRQLRELARKTWVEGFYLVETHFTGHMEMGNQTVHTALRMFQRRPQYHWQGLIHEQLLHNFPTYLPERFQNSPVRMNHYGYLKERIEDRSKRERNLQLLEQQAAEGADAFTEFNVGSEYGAMGDWQRARPHFERALEMVRPEQGWQSRQFSTMLVARLIAARRSTGDLDGAIELIGEALRWWPEFTDMVHERALIHVARREFEQAKADAERCLTMGDAPARYVAVQGKGGYQARVLLAGIERELGNAEGALAHLQRAYGEAPVSLPIVLDLADVMLEVRDPQQTEAFFDEHLAEPGPTGNLLLATAFYEKAHFEHARRYYERVIEASPHHAAALIGLAEVHLSEHRYADAVAALSRVSPLDPFAYRAARSEFLAGVLANDQAAVDRAVATLTRSDVLPVGERSFYTAWKCRLRGESAILAADPHAVSAIMVNLEALAKLEEADEFERLVSLLEEAEPEERERRLLMGSLYLRRRFPDMAAEEYLAYVERFGPDAQSLTGLGKAATMKEMWQDAAVFLHESLQLDPDQGDVKTLLQLVAERVPHDAEA